MRRSQLLLKLMLCLSVISCRRDPIWDSGSGYHLQFDIQDSVLYCQPQKAELVQVIFYDPSTGKKVSETYMPPEGGIIHCVPAGTYDIVAFTLGAERTEMTYARDLNLLTAQTSTVQTIPETVINSPDHVFAGVLRNAVIPELCSADGPFTLTVPLKSVCDSWIVEVTGVRGLRYACGSFLYLTHQVREVLIRDFHRQGDCMIRTSGKTDTLSGRISFPLCTFGMGEGNEIYAVVEIEAQDGRVHTGTFDVTSQVRDPINCLNAITVDFPTELMPLTQGGLDPTTDEWDENHEFMDIM